MLIIASLACFRSDTEPEYRFKFVSASGMNQYLTLTMLWGRDANAVYAATHTIFQRVLVSFGRPTSTGRRRGGPRGYA